MAGPHLKSALFRGRGNSGSDNANTFEVDDAKKTRVCQFKKRFGATSHSARDLLFVAYSFETLHFADSGHSVHFDDRFDYLE